VVKRYGARREKLNIQKAGNFFAINLAKHYGEIRFILGPIIRFGKVDITKNIGVFSFKVALSRNVNYVGIRTREC